MAKIEQDEYSQVEAERRREEALKRMLNTPHKPHKEEAGRQKPSRPTPHKSKGI